MIILLCVVLFAGIIFGYELRITDTTGFSAFVNRVNSGSTYLGTTVFLDSDLSLSGYTINPIGTSSTYQFRGVFDGQGYVISNLKISSSSSRFSGLFGRSNGLTIRNVVLDSSCSITNTYIDSGSVYVGGIIGYCNAYNGQCNIENNVNMASVTFSGDISNHLYLGGIAGYIQSYNYISTVKNCANYGSVTHSGTSSNSYIGGLVGVLDNSYYKYIYNCLNYGTITHSGTTTSSYLFLGGIVGDAYHTYIENCVSSGKIFSNNNTYAGGLVGYVGSYTYINYCYYTNELSGFSMYGKGTPTSIFNTLGYNNNTFKLDETVLISNYSGNSFIDALNATSDYYMLRGYSHWLLNKNSKTVSFTINGRANPIKMDYQIILLPSLASEGYVSFNGWHINSGCTTPLTSYEVTADTSLYGKFEEDINNYIITFNTREGTFISPKQAQFGTTVSLPISSTRDYCTIASWENVYGDNLGLNLTMPAYNITLYAVWECTHIKTPNDFLDFSKVVNSGASYYGTTVFLDSDLSLSGYTINPIGTSSSYQFSGVFDGQGYVISNLNITRSSLYLGLFGRSNGLTIRNVVLDSSCSMINSYIGSNWAYACGIIGYCSGQCNIENNVNMASVTFSGDISGDNNLLLGGIAGYLYSSRYTPIMKNCANYGSVTHSGTSSNSYVGGLVGYLYSSSYYKYYKYIYNCLNYGTITHSGKTRNSLYLGGIVGYAYYSYIENCVSAGRISSNNNIYTGSLAGYVDSETYTNYCYYTNSVGISSLLGYYSSSPTITNTPDSPSKISSTLIENINTQASDNGWNKWFFNKDNKNISFNVNNSIGFSVSSQIILVPNLTDNDSNGWFINYKGNKDNKASLAVGITVPLFVILVAIIIVVVLVIHKKKSKPQSSNSNKVVNNIAINGNINNMDSDRVITNKSNQAENDIELDNANESINNTITIDTISNANKENTTTTTTNNNNNSNNNEVLYHLQNKQTYSRFVVPTVNNSEFIVTGRSLNSTYKLYPSNFVRPTLKQALIAANLNEMQVMKVVDACTKAGQIAEDEGKLSRTFTKDDATAVAMYTYDFGEENFESNPYRIINKSLADRDYSKIQSASGILYLIMTALRKLPRVTGKTLYRGVRGSVNLDETHYHIGNTVTWSALSSTSPDMNAIQAFLAKGSESGKASGTMFFIENGWGYDIQPYSLFPDESEVLLEPERQFKVTGVIPSTEFIIIKLEMLDTPLCLPNVFGGGEENEEIPITNTNNFNLNTRTNY